jgi:hypothetical protein
MAVTKGCVALRAGITFPYAFVLPFKHAFITAYAANPFPKILVRCISGLFVLQALNAVSYLLCNLIQVFFHVIDQAGLFKIK